jgi:hypothetical protein
MIYQELEIKFEDGEIRNIRLTPIGDWPMKFLQEETGMVCMEGDLYSQVIGLLFCWVSRYDMDNKKWAKVKTAVQSLIAEALSHDTCGQSAIDSASGDSVVLIYREEKSSVICVGELMDRFLYEASFHYHDLIMSVEILRKYTSADTLKSNLKLAIEAENYDLAAKLHDQLKGQNTSQL